MNQLDARSDGMSARLWAMGLLLLLALGYPLVVSSNYAIDIGMMILFTAFLGQSWNIAGGFAGQLSFGHTIFFGVGAYCSAILVATYGVNPWLAWLMAIGLGAVLGAAIGYLSFRFGLKGSYFALITLAFAEMFRVLADSAPITRGGLGILVPVKQGVSQLQFVDARAFYYLALVLCLIGLGIAYWLKSSRFGARLEAIRENEDAARALGIHVLKEKIKCLALSGALGAAGGSFYIQKYLYIDPHLAFSVARSVEMLLVSMIGGAGTVFGPLVGAATLGVLAELTRSLSDAQGLSLVVYGVVLIFIIGFLPNGLISLLRRRTRKQGGHNAGSR